MSTPHNIKVVPGRLEPRKLVSQGAILEGALATDSMARLHAAVLGLEDEVGVHLEFGRDEENRPLLDGRFSLGVELQCQRCLGGVAIDLKGAFHLGLVWREEQVDQLPRALDPWWVEDEWLDVCDLIEDELLLALPIVPRHPEGQCFIDASYVGGDQEEERQSPFNVLAQLKKQ